MANRNFSTAQTTYMLAMANYQVAHDRDLAYDNLMDAECEKLGIETPYGILPEGHPMWVEGQRLLDAENAAKDLMRQAACLLFDWATETTLAKHGTAKQKQDVRDMVAKVKKMAHVEKFWIDLVDLSMKLDLSAKATA